MILKSLYIGTEVTLGKAIFFFGNRHATLTAIQKQFPTISFSRIKQTHGDQICKSKLGQDLLILADAHISKDPNHGLCVITADCAPILIYSDQSKIIAAIHAGWRGVASRILPKTLSHLKDMGVDITKLKLALGPHIQMDSFEVDRAVKKEILDSISSSQSDKHFVDISDKKSKVDLHEVLKDQILEFPISRENLFFIKEDTRSNQQYHSYRRDGERSGRQISFVGMFFKDGGSRRN